MFVVKTSKYVSVKFQHPSHNINVDKIIVLCFPINPSNKNITGCIRNTPILFIASCDNISIITGNMTIVAKAIFQITTIAYNNAELTSLVKIALNT